MEAPSQAAPVLAVGAVVLDGEPGEPRVLLVKRGRPPGAGEWTLPGGKLEPGESPGQPVLRELHEETGIGARVLGELGVVQVARDGYRFAIHEHLLVPLPGSGPPVAADDAADARWFTRGELGSLGLHRDVVLVIERAAAMLRARS
ncbi:MAG: NUDIX domain-containing protein [Polyangiaceae bacterium]